MFRGSQVETKALMQHDAVPTSATGSDRGGASAGDHGRMRTTPLERAPTRWRILVEGARSGSENMARDHALAHGLSGDAGNLRIYSWARPTVSFGRNEPARGLYDAEAADREGVTFVRRPTGGRAVLHDRELTYAVTAPLRAWGGLRGAYRAVNEGLVSALRAIGVEAELAPAPTSGDAPLSAGPCFQRPAEGEVVVHGRKLVGSAQARIGGAFLQHGSLLLSGSQDALARIGPEAAAESGAPPVTLRSLLGTVPDREILVGALIRGLQESLGGAWSRGETTASEESSARGFRERYASRAWTWRR